MNVIAATHRNVGLLCVGEPLNFALLRLRLSAAGSACSHCSRRNYDLFFLLGCRTLFVGPERHVHFLPDVWLFAHPCTSPYQSHEVGAGLPDFTFSVDGGHAGSGLLSDRVPDDPMHNITRLRALSASLLPSSEIFGSHRGGVLDIRQNGLVWLSQVRLR